VNNSRKIMIAGNWKMNGSESMIRSLLAGINAGLNETDPVDVAVFPPFPYLSLVQGLCDGSRIEWGGQNVNAAASGAHTGESSAAMLKEFGCRYVLIGHSERRAIYGESDKEIAQRFVGALEGNLQPVLCVGETIQERESDQTESVINRQIDAVLELAGIDGFKNAIVAYEPVWAIGTGLTASPDQAQEIHALIRDKFRSLDGIIAGQMRILYGGSVNGSNAADLFAREDIDGGLVGGASLKAEDFLAICRNSA
jgi:triosephosphate isomerase